MLSSLPGLSAADLAAIADLEQRVVAADGGRLKLEWGTLRSRDAHQVSDLLWRESGLVVGFLGLYSFGSATVELAGMVDPAYRRRGIGSALLDAARRLLAERGRDRALLVVPRVTNCGAAFARHHTLILEHSEHFLALGELSPAMQSPDVTLRPAAMGDRSAVRRLLSQGFGWDPGDSDAASLESTTVIARGGHVIGMLRVEHTNDTAGIYGFVIDEKLRGQGIGRDALGRVCRQLLECGTRRITLEVEVNNEHALGLYTSLGFRKENTEDYFVVPV